MNLDVTSLLGPFLPIAVGVAFFIQMLKQLTFLQRFLDPKTPVGKNTLLLLPFVISFIAAGGMHAFGWLPKEAENFGWAVGALLSGGVSGLVYDLIHVNSAPKSTTSQDTPQPPPSAG